MSDLGDKLRNLVEGMETSLGEDLVLGLADEADQLSRYVEILARERNLYDSKLREVRELVDHLQRWSDQFKDVDVSSVEAYQNAATWLHNIVGDWAEFND